jgi:hypothetical protein
MESYVIFIQYLNTPTGVLLNKFITMYVCVCVCVYSVSNFHLQYSARLLYSIGVDILV